MFEENRFIALCPTANRTWLPAICATLTAQADVYLVNTPLRRAHFVAQIAYESDYFTRVEENLDYSAGRIKQVFRDLADRAQELSHNPEALANAAYANLFGNGDEASGDGWRYHGRGLIELTCYDNYKAQGLDEEPETAADPAKSIVITLRFWLGHGCNEFADLDDVRGVTREINGSEMLGLEARKVLTQRAKEIFV